jgi:hypothetical protein
VRRAALFRDPLRNCGPSPEPQPGTLVARGLSAASAHTEARPVTRAVPRRGPSGRRRGTGARANARAERGTRAGAHPDLDASAGPLALADSVAVAARMAVAVALVPVPGRRPAPVPSPATLVGRPLGSVSIPYDP